MAYASHNTQTHNVFKYGNAVVASPDHAKGIGVSVNNDANELAT